MSMPSPRARALDVSEIDRILARAVGHLARTVAGIAILVPERHGVDDVRASVSPSGWCELGTLRDAQGRFWYRVLWHAETGEGRLLREWPKARRGVLGEAIGGGPDARDA